MNCEHDCGNGFFCRRCGVQMHERPQDMQSNRQSQLQQHYERNQFDSHPFGALGYGPLAGYGSLGGLDEKSQPWWSKLIGGL